MAEASHKDKLRKMQESYTGTNATYFGKYAHTLATHTYTPREAKGTNATYVLRKDVSRQRLTLAQSHDLLAVGDPGWVGWLSREGGGGLTQSLPLPLSPSDPVMLLTQAGWWSRLASLSDPETPP